MANAGFVVPHPPDDDLVRVFEVGLRALELREVEQDFAVFHASHRLLELVRTRFCPVQQRQRSGHVVVQRADMSELQKSAQEFNFLRRVQLLEGCRGAVFLHRALRPGQFALFPQFRRLFPVRDGVGDGQCSGK